MSDATNLPAVLADSSAGDEYAITAPDWGQPQGNGRILSSFDVATPEGKIGLFNAVQGDSVKSGDVINTEVEIVHVVAYAVRFVDKDGQIVDGIRTVLVLKDGRSVAFVSETLYRSAFIGWPTPSASRRGRLALRLRSARRKPGRATESFNLCQSSRPR